MARAVLTCCAVLMGLLAASVGAADTRLRLISADVLENLRTDGEPVQMLNGNVVFQKEDMQLETDQARFLKDTGVSYLTGGVVMTRPDERLTCDSLVFYNSEDRLSAFGNVRFVQEDQVIVCDQFLYWTKLDSGVARGSVVLTQGTRELTAREVRTRKTDGPRGLSFQALGAVVVDEGNRRVQANEIRYDDDTGVMDLIEDALVVEGTRKLVGNRISLFYLDDQLQTADVTEGATASSVLSARLSADAVDLRSFTDVLTSRAMHADFENDRLRRLLLIGMATSLYHVVEDTILQGVNHANGDTLAMGFDENSELVRLQVKGGARGRFEPEKGNTDVDTVVVYKAKFLDYDIPGQITHLTEDARVDFRDNGLAAGEIVLTWQDNFMRAEEAYGQSPTLYQTGRDPMTGKFMEFDLINEIGRVVQGRTKLADGFYHGAVVHRFPENVYYVERSLYTTCELDTPHFYFAARKMKMLQGDKVIARPIILYVADVPLIGLPFAVFPNQGGGRRSGLIMPGYGETRTHGQYIKGLGYFWATNNYMDFTTWLDFYDQKGILFKGRLRYNKRYQYTGGLMGNYHRDAANKQIEQLFKSESPYRWDLKWSHRQTIDPTQRLNINVQYTSDPAMYRDLGLTREVRQKQQILSNASYSKNFRSISSSLTLALSDRYDLQAQGKRSTPPTGLNQKIEERTRTLPRFSFSRSSSELIKPAKGATPRWYNQIRWGFSSNVNNNQSLFWESVLRDTVVQVYDSVLQTWIEEDSSMYDWSEERTIQNKSSVKNNFNISAQQNLFKYISLNLSTPVAQHWTPTYRKARIDPDGLFVVDSTNRIVYDEVHEIAVRHTGRISLRAQTNIYGLFPVNIGRLQAIRHTLKPSITYSYTPDFSKPVFGYDLGYFQQDAAGEKFDRFAGSTISGTAQRESQSVSFSLQNIFQTKSEVDEQAVKTTILTWNMSSGYDFTADSLKLSPIRSSFRSPFLDKLKLDVSMTHDIYVWDEENQRRINQVLAVPRLVSMDAKSSIRLSGERYNPFLFEEADEDTAAVDSLAGSDVFEEDESLVSGVRTMAQPKIATGNLWEAAFSLRYSYKPTSIPEKRESFRISGNFKINVGPGWKVGYSAQIDGKTQELIYHDLTLYRQIHCWELAFNWTPSGFGQGYFLRINVRDADLSDLKYESRGGRQNLLGY